MEETLTIWDCEHKPHTIQGRIVFWGERNNAEDVISLPDYVEEHDTILRGKYISFINNLSSINIRGKNIVDHLDYDGSISIWWMTHIAEKSPHKSSGIYECVRILAIEKILKDYNCNKIILYTSNKRLREVLRHLTNDLDISFEYHYINKKKKVSFRNIYNNIPYAIRGLISFRHYIRKLSLRKIKKPKWFSKNSIFICTYFFNFDENLAVKGLFKPNQWGNLPNHFIKNGYKINWLHFIIDVPGGPNVNQCINYINKFNKCNSGNANYSVQSFVTIPIILKVLFKWLKYNIIYYQLFSIKKFFYPQDSNVWLWPFLKNDWKTSIIGPISVFNLFCIELFFDAFKNIPYQKKGLYIWENQGWECSLIRGWKLNNHGEIYGVQHSTLRFWDFNNFDGYNYKIAKYTKPLPYKIAINGPQALKLFTNADNNINEFVNVEAMRYQYLTINAGKKNHSSYNYNYPTELKNTDRLTILVICESSYNQTVKILRFINELYEKIDSNLDIWIKLHPACEIDISSHYEMNFNILNEPLSNTSLDFDLAITGASTSAALDVYLMKKPVLIYWSGDDFNYSPLRGNTDVHYILTIDDVKDIIDNRKLYIPKNNIDTYFWIDSTYKQWSALAFD